MNRLNHLYTFLLSFLFLSGSLFSQDYQLKKEVSEAEILYLQDVIEHISITDQQYRNYIANGTLDDALIDDMDAVYEAKGIEAYMQYKKSLNLSLAPPLKDSLWQLQHKIDIRNHLTLRGIFDTYGFLSEEILGKKFYIQLLVLMHPPKDWAPEEYLEEYAALLFKEVKAERMPAKTYATFYDNIRAKIMREPQLYGTNQQFDVKTNSVKPPIIENIKKSNEARKAIGLPILAEGEYRLLGEE